jgi:hypothetical protein
VPVVLLNVSTLPEEGVAGTDLQIRYRLPEEVVEKLELVFYGDDADRALRRALAT